MNRRAGRPGLVSVVIPVFNRAALLREAVASVMAQTYADWEIVIVDDGSTDDTAAAVADLVRSDPQRVRSLRQECAGPGAAREAGRRVVRGEFLQFLDSDDLLAPRKFEAQLEALRQRPDAGVAYGVTDLLLPSGDSEPATRRTGEALDTLFPALLEGRIWMTETPLFRAAVCERAGGWSNLRLEEDWEFEVRVAALGTRLVHVGERVSVHRDHEGPRAGRGEPLDASRLLEQAKAHVAIFEHANAVRVAAWAPGMFHLSRRLFLLSRRCGAAGLTVESRRLFGLARAAAGQRRATGLDFRLYRTLAAVFGWTLAGRMAVASDRWRSGSGG